MRQAALAKRLDAVDLHLGAANDSRPADMMPAPAALPTPTPFAPPASSTNPKRILVLFGADWDDALLSQYAQTKRYIFYVEGFDLFSFPSNAELMWFDLPRFVDKMASKYGGRIDAVVSTNEQFGALAAALLAERLGLPGTRAATVALCQHKLRAHHHLQPTHQHLLPDWMEAIDYTISKKQSARYPYPSFVRPLKATFSVLAREVTSGPELRKHLSFYPWEKHIIKRLIRPFNQALKLLGGYTVDAHHMVMTPCLSGLQVNVDGYCYRGQTTVLGICDEVMYPEKSQGLQSFMRFEYPGNYAGQWREKIEATTREVMTAYGFNHGFFNLEFFVDAATGALKLIEVNPRMAAQLAQFYKWTQGFDAYEAAFAMACDEAIAVNKKPAFGAAASFIWRSFDGTSCPRLPTAADMAWLAAEYPDARLLLYPKKGNALRRDVKWLGSHRWAALNMPSANSKQLKLDYERICQRLEWPAPY